MKAESRLKKILAAGHFAVPRVRPPKGADAAVVRKERKILKDYVDSVNVTDNQTGVVRLSSLRCVLLKKEGLDRCFRWLHVTATVSPFSPTYWVHPPRYP